MVTLGPMVNTSGLRKQQVSVYLSSCLGLCLWLGLPCSKGNALSGSQMCIVTGYRTDFAIALIDRTKKLFASSRGAAAFDKKKQKVKNTKLKLLILPCHHNRQISTISFLLNLHYGSQMMHISKSSSYSSFWIYF